MRTYAIICYAVAAIAEAGGLVLVVLSLRESRKILIEWERANPNPTGKATWAQLGLVNEMIRRLAGTSRWQPRLAVSLLAVGILAGTLGNFTGLPPS